MAKRSGFYTFRNEDFAAPSTEFCIGVWPFRPATPTEAHVYHSSPPYIGTTPQKPIVAVSGEL